MPKYTDEQSAAIDSIGSHVLVSAGAGSGKTFVLVERYINILRSDLEADISDIIAVTYTRKAAEEMRSRLKAELTKVVALAGSEELPRWSRLLSELESARIGTIHSLCESILKNYPAEAGIDPDAAILDDLERAEMLAACVDECIREIIDNPEEVHEALLEFPIETLKQWLSEFLKSPLKYKQARSLFNSGSVDDIAAYAARFVEQDMKRVLDELSNSKPFMNEVSQILDNPWLDQESKFGQAQAEMTRYLLLITDLEKTIAERWDGLVQLGRMESARTAGGESAKDLRHSMRLIRARCSAIAKKNSGALNEADVLATRLLRGLIVLADRVLHAYESRKQIQQRLDFDDLIERCHALLTRDSSARRQLIRSLRAVLVDEFQDTNWMQAQMLSSLASGQAKLFLIGDDKQSIYKFQGADVGTFNSCKQFLSSLEDASAHAKLSQSFGLPVLTGQGQLMTLSQSFRSHPEIVSFVNAVFRKLFDAGKESESYKSRFQSLSPARKREDDGVRIDVIYSPPSESNSAEMRGAEDRLEAKLLCNWIQEKVSSAQIFDKELGENRNLSYSDIAILLQANADFAAIEFALSQAKIPYVSIAGSGFLERQEIYDLENMLKWLVSPQDGHALFSVLRSPLFGISDDLLHEMKGSSRNSLWQVLRQRAEAAGEDMLAGCVRRLQDFLRAAAQMSLPEILQKIILDTAYDIVLLAAHSGKQRSRNVWKFVTLASQRRKMSMAEFLGSLHAMRKLGIKNLTDAPMSSDDSVRIMTIHRSKGLEFGAVILPRLGKSVQERSQKLIFGKDFGIALDPTREAEDEKPTFFSTATKLNATMGEEEKKRLLYVALTRARDYLALFITSRSRRGANFGAWLVESLELPEPGSEVYEGVAAHEASDGETCQWHIAQANASELYAEAEEQSGSDDNAAPPFAPSSTSLPRVFPLEQDNSDFELWDMDLYGMPDEPLMDFSSDTAPDSVYFDAAGNPDDENVIEDSAGRLNLSLIMRSSKAGRPVFKPVPWQTLLRVTPAENQPLINQTVMGNYFHLLMGNLGSNLELPSEEVRLALCSHHSISMIHPEQIKRLLQEAERMLSLFAASPLYSMMKTARARLHECGYVIVREGGEVQNLRPDLLLEGSDGRWQIVDYKTDNFELRDLKKQIASHGSQLASYVDDFQVLTGQKPSAWIYFAQYGRLELVNLAPAVQLSLPIEINQ